MGHFVLTVRIFRMSRNFCSIKIRKYGIIVNETTLHRTPHDTEINNYKSPYGRMFTNTFFIPFLVQLYLKKIDDRQMIFI